jgi:thiamine-monophosphate kinase
MAEGEFAFIDKHLRPLAEGTAAALGLTDDAAVLAPTPGHEIVLTKDALVAGVHFLPDDPADTVAQKLLRVNLSDLAAMGARPVGHLLVIARPADLGEAWVEGFCRGLASDQAIFGSGLLGGDTVSTPGPLTLSLTAVGEVPAGSALRRNGARAGDDLWVSGTLGDGALGLRILTGELDAAPEAAAVLIERYRVPSPRVALGVALRGLASSAIDVSDGLLADLGHILEASAVGAEIEAAALPLSEAARGLPGADEAALAGGDDYELLFTAASDRRSVIETLGRDLELRLSRIGRITVDPALRVRGPDGREITSLRRGWQHF